MFKLESGEVIDISEKPREFIKKETELNGNDIESRIIRTLISAEKPLRLSELSKQSKIYKEKLQYNLKNMVEKGLVLTAMENGKKYYAPQTIFWDNDILYKINERIIPIIKDIYKNMDYSQVESSNMPEPLINCLQMALKLFSFEIGELKKIKNGKMILTK